MPTEAVSTETTPAPLVKLQGLQLDKDTLITLAVVWFLLSEDGEIDWNVLLTVAVLLLLGI
jgi:hypothetical protein